MGLVAVLVVLEMVQGVDGESMRESV